MAVDVTPKSNSPDLYNLIAGSDTISDLDSILGGLSQEIKKFGRCASGRLSNKFYLIYTIDSTLTDIKPRLERSIETVIDDPADGRLIYDGGSSNPNNQLFGDSDPNSRSGASTSNLISGGNLSRASPLPNLSQSAFDNVCNSYYVLMGCFECIDRLIGEMTTLVEGVGDGRAYVIVGIEIYGIANQTGIMSYSVPILRIESGRGELLAEHQRNIDTLYILLGGQLKPHRESENIDPYQELLFQLSNSKFGAVIEEVRNTNSIAKGMKCYWKLYDNAPPAENIAIGDINFHGGDPLLHIFDENLRGRMFPGKNNLHTGPIQRIAENSGIKIVNDPAFYFGDEYGHSNITPIFASLANFPHDINGRKPSKEELIKNGKVYPLSSEYIPCDSIHRGDNNMAGHIRPPIYNMEPQLSNLLITSSNLGEACKGEWNAITENNMPFKDDTLVINSSLVFDPKGDVHRDISAKIPYGNLQCLRLLNTVPKFDYVINHQNHPFNDRCGMTFIHGVVSPGYRFNE